MNYKRHYDLLIAKAKPRGLDKSQLTGYYEKHHVVPRCLGGSDRAKAQSALQVVCPHCCKTGSSLAMHRWHFNNCALMSKDELSCKLQEQVLHQICSLCEWQGQSLAIHMGRCYKT